MRKMNLQLFADPAGANGSNGAAVGDPATNGANAPQATPAGQIGAGTTPQIDYTKIQQMLEGTLAAKEDTALKAYFKQQGLSQEEAEQAMAAFKAKKAASQPDVNAIQTQLTEAQAQAQRALLDKEATLVAIGIGIDAKTIPYVLKMADLSQVLGQDGKINDVALKTALNKVLEDVPALKPQAQGQTGFVQIGAAGGTGQQATTDDALKKAFGL